MVAVLLHALQVRLVVTLDERGIMLRVPAQVGHGQFPHLVSVARGPVQLVRKRRKLAVSIPGDNLD